MSDKRNQQQSANHTRTRLVTNYSPLKTERFQMILLCDLHVVFKVVIQ